MKNVKPMAGQVWEFLIPEGHYEAGNKIKLISLSRSKKWFLCKPINFKSNAIEISVSVEFLHLNFTFIPQTDLEWLACNFNSWTTDLLFIWKKGNVCYATIDPKVVVSDCYTRQQWQDKRYELGLDEKPKRSIYLGPAPVKLAEKLFITHMQKEMKMHHKQQAREAQKKQAPQKEIKMIDLSAAQVGDEFVDGVGEICKLVYMTDMDKCFEIGSSGLLITIDDNGGCSSAPARQLVSKHDPRHWLKDLPDVGLFNDEVKFLAWCNHRKGWCAFEGEPIVDFDDSHTNGFFSNYPLTGIKMPTLTGDEWKDSKISIPDLKAWQLNKKEQS